MRPIILLALCSFLLCARLQAVQTDTHGIHAVPVPGAVVIDGKLDDWDLSGAVLQCYDVESLRDIYSADIAMMYDPANLYVALHWRCQNPMSNSHDPRYQAEKGWAGDCVQLRIKTDRIVHVTAWYFAAKQEPAIQLSYGKGLAEPFGGGDKQLYRTTGWTLTDGAEMAFLKDADGKGYVQEMKLPWALLTTGKRYGAGDSFACGIELLWGAADWPIHRYADNMADGATSREFFFTAKDAWGPVFLESAGKLNLPPPSWQKAMQQQDEVAGAVAIPYDLPKDARVTLAISDATGKRVRQLTAAQPRPKGANQEKWDGMDDEGRALPPGDYQFQALHHDGIHVNWAMSFANPGNPSWDTSDNRGAFYADHTMPRAVATAGNFVALGCPMGEGGKHLIGCDLSGQRLWGLANRAAFAGGNISLATDGSTLWVASDGRESTIYRVNAATGTYSPWQRTAKDAEGRDYQVLDLVVSGPGQDKRGRAVNLTAIAYRSGTIAACLAAENAISLLDARSGAVKGRISVPAPQSAVFIGDDALVVLSAGALLRVGLDGSSQPFSALSFADAFSVTADGGGRVLVSVRGPEMNVKVLGADGKLVGEIGKRGGRPHNGAFIDGAMRLPAQIAIDSNARLWVAEETANPKRTSVWSLDGALVFDLNGTTSYAGAGAINADDPTMAFSDNTVYHIDLAKGSWRPVYSVGGSGDPDEIFQPRFDSRVRIFNRAGATYLYTTDRTQDCLCLVGKDGRWRPAACVGFARKDNDHEVPINYLHALMKGHDGQLFVWVDRNGDGLVSADELSFAAVPVDGGTLKVAGGYWGRLPDVEGTIPFLDGEHRVMAKLAITAITPSGAPLYDLAQVQLVPLKSAYQLQPGGEGMIMGGSDGRVYVNQDPLIAIEKDGTVVGGYPSHHVSVHGSHTAKAPRPGYLIGPSSILGTADFGKGIGEVFSMNGNLGENYLFTSDCLWIQALFKDTRGGFETPGQAVRGMAMDAITAGGESFGGNFMRTKDGKTYLVIGGTDARVLEVTGLDSITRFAGRFTYTPAQFAVLQQRLAERQAASAAIKAATIGKLAAPITIDGKAAKWPELLDDHAPAIEIQESPRTRYGRVLARYDAQNLYLAYRVFAHSDRMRNAGQDDHLLFKTGDAVDLMLDNGSTGLRLLMTMSGGKPVAVLYEKKVAGVSEKDRVPFSSPWRTITFDRVTRPAGIELASGPISGGFFVEAKVPWSILGIVPRPGAKLRGDFGILFADSGGTSCVARQYWNNKATNLVNDVPGEAELTPTLWGEIGVE
jgi:hypothetical protein